MLKATFLAFLIAMAITANDCDIDLGNLDEYVVNYQTTVTNTAAEPAMVLILMRGVRRVATLASGQSVVVTGFTPGTMIISVKPALDVVKALKEKRAEIEKRLDQK